MSDINNNPAHNEDDELESFLEMVEKQLSMIEVQELVDGITGDDLKMKGYVGDKNLEFKKPLSFDKKTEHGIEIEETIVFSQRNNTDISEAGLDTIQYLPDIAPGTLIGHLTIPSGKSGSDSRVISLFCSDTYMTKSNIDVGINGDKLIFTSKIKGKVVLLNSVPYVIPSDKDGYFLIKTSPDNMRAAIDLYPARGDGKFVTFEEVLNELERKGITRGVKQTSIKEYVEQVQNTKTEVLDMVIAEGKEPVNGQDAQIEYLFPNADTAFNFRILPNGRVDYRRKAEIPVIKKGGVLVRIGLPSKGQDGFDISGKVLKATDGRVPILFPGENVTVSKDEREFIAECDGQISLNGKVLSVYRHYLVDGDVDFERGNIEFDGNITIKGSVLEGATVKASGSVIIMKNIESANVYAGCDVKVVGGIFNRNRDSIVVCGRNLEVYHLQNAKLEVQGDIHVGSSCIHSTVYCNGKMYVQNQKGVIVGGVINVLDGVDAKNIGTEMGVKTEIIAGNDYLVQKTISEFRKTLDIYKDNLEKIDRVLLPLMRLIKNKLAMSLEKKNRLAIVLEKRKKILKNKEMMEWKLQDIEGRITADIKATIKVREVLSPDVVIRIKDRSKKIHTPCHNVTVYYDKGKKELETGPY